MMLHDSVKTPKLSNLFLGLDTRAHREEEGGMNLTERNIDALKGEWEEVVGRRGSASLILMTAAVLSGITGVE